MFTRLTPILPVANVREELTFSERLGVHQRTDSTEAYQIDELAEADGARAR